ncbi:MAG: hypothetical protein ACC660_05760, partial [Acidimicrobiales bacterium]
RGFPDLPDRVVGEAVCQVAETLPAPVAEQLAPQVMALSPLTTADHVGAVPSAGLDALDALATVPAHDLAEFDSDTQDLDAELDVDDVSGEPVAIGAGDDIDGMDDVVDDAVDDDAGADDGFGTGQSQPDGAGHEDTVTSPRAHELDGLDGLDELDELDELRDVEVPAIHEALVGGPDEGYGSLPDNDLDPATAPVHEPGTADRDIDPDIDAD